MSQATMVFQVSSKAADVRITSPPPNWVDIPVGATVSHQMTATDGVQPYQWAVVGPPGMSIGNTGMLMWTPQSVVSVQATVTVTDAS